MDTRRMRCLHLVGILLCLFLNPILMAEMNPELLDDYIKEQCEGQRYEAFDWNLLKSLGTPDFGNVLLSPLSVKMVLAMVYEGASGATEKELEQVVNFPANKQNTKTKYQQILNSLNSANVDHTLDIGSRVFLDSSVQAQQRFQATLKEFYNTDVKYVNFYNTSDTKDEINYWVSNVTHGHIRDLVAEGDLQGATMILTNALYYKGLWKHPFPRENTQYGVFHTSQNMQFQVPYMHVKSRLYYSDSLELDSKILRLTFKGGNLAMFIILPNSKKGLQRLINDLNPRILRRQICIMDDQAPVNVYLPKFSFEFNARLGRILQSLGLNHIFQNTASLAGIARGKKLMVNNILQKAGIEVNEEGSTAYAATEITLVNKFGEREVREVNFNASHPFLFYIEDEFTGNVLFAGKVENPVQENQPPFAEELNFPSRIGESNTDEQDISSPSSSTEAPVVSTANAQNQNINQNNFGNNNYPNYYPEENDLQAEQFFYFDIDLLKEISLEQQEGNILISPLSIKSVLAMILEGAEDETAEELRMALHVPNNKRVRNQFQKLLAEFERPLGGVIIQMANKIFVSNNLTPLAEYKDTLTKYYNSNVTKVNFYNPTESANLINHWANEKTHGLIPTLVDEGSFGGDISILLANVLYFKGQWVKAFSELGTKNSCFRLSNGECQMTPMMDVVDNFKYEEVKKLDAKFLELPYSGGEYSMIIVLPNKNGIQQLSRDIIRASINGIVQNMSETEVFVTLPRFKIEYFTDLVNYLPKVHVSNILSHNANLNKIAADVSMRVSNVLHKTYIEVNERGTVAAASTGAVVIPLMGTSKPRFKADHPFLFFIRHTSTGTILFEGRLSVPERANVQQNHQQHNQQNQRPNQQSNIQQNQQPNIQQNQQSSIQQNQQPNIQQNQQPMYRPTQGHRRQPNLQRPVQQPQPTVNAPQNNFNSNYPPMVQTEPQFQSQSQNQNRYSTPQQNANTQQQYYTPQTPFLDNNPTSYQGQTPNIRNSPTLMFSISEHIQKQAISGPPIYTSRPQGLQDNANDLGNIDNSPIVYPGSNSRQ